MTGDERPKQFCPVLGAQTLLDQTRRRSARVIAPDHTLVVLVATQERFYAPLVGDLPTHCVVVQPENRGTAAAILYALVRLTAIAPVAPVAIFPSDHYVADDERFMAYVDGAFDVLESRPDLLVLLGITPDSGEVKPEWIEIGPGIPGPWQWPVLRVRHFWNNPSPATARALRAQGCLWSSSVMVAHSSVILSAIRATLPALVEAFGPIRSRLTTPWSAKDLRTLYASLPSTDFSEQVLATSPPNLAALPLTGVGWSDLREPQHVTATLARMATE